MIGDLPARDLEHVDLSPLSAAAIAELAGGSGRDPDAPHRLTGGNPFFITEVPGSAAEEAPASVRDAVLARVARLGDESRSLLNLVAVVPGAMATRGAMAARPSGCWRVCRRAGSRASP